MLNPKLPNRLINEKSPYLLQHALNPVNWYPWGDEAFEKARNEDKPIFLSIGYSTCHWCHVMAHESFEDNQVAEILNNNFISIKLDREERPDIDHIYMTACQMLTGHGGWPLSIFMSADKKPFFAGTYFPKTDRYGMPGFISLLANINKTWHQKREVLLKSSEQILESLMDTAEPQEDVSLSDLPGIAFSSYVYSFDAQYGGFGNAPKFPSAHNLMFLLRYWHHTGDEKALDMVEKSLDSMHQGGMFDHIGFGFSRYSTDRQWLTPHFEKMLYDNALLAIIYLETYQATHKKHYADVANKILSYIMRDMLSPEGGFYSAEDADSEGVEGKFYVWTRDEILDVLGEKDGVEYCKLFDITPNGNFDGFNIPNLIGKETSTLDWDFINGCRTKLFLVREKRIHPHKDDKILTSWNGLMIAALSMAARILNEPLYANAAKDAVTFIYSRLFTSKGRLLARYRDGDSAILAFADDYTFLIWGLIELYETSFKADYLEKAIELNRDLIKLFWDEKDGGLFMYGIDSEQLITRPKEAYDGAMPSSNSVAALNFIRLARLTGKHDLEDRSKKIFELFGSSLESVPNGHSFMLSGILYSIAKSQEIIIAGKEPDDLFKFVFSSFRPFTATLLCSDALSDVAPFTEPYSSVDNKPTAYVCENFSCSLPVTDVAGLSALI